MRWSLLIGIKPKEQNYIKFSNKGIGNYLLSCPFHSHSPINPLENVPRQSKNKSQPLKIPIPNLFGIL